LALLLVGMVFLLPVYATVADEAAPICRIKGTDDTLRPIPESLVAAAKRLFGLDRMPDRQIRRSTVYRCADGHILLCNYGANLPCGKADADRRPAGAQAWCRAHPDADFIPRSAIPWGNIYDWRCAASAPQILRQIEEIDPRGFVARYWKPAD
jgi:hypothetical protein